MLSLISAHPLATLITAVAISVASAAGGVVATRIHLTQTVEVVQPPVDDSKPPAWLEKEHENKRSMRERDLDAMRRMVR